MHRAMPLPQNHFGFAEPLGGLPALQHVWIPHHHLIQRNAARVTRVAPKVLIGQEENLAIAAESPLECADLALEEVQTMPPRSPQNALMAAVEFM